MKTSVHSMVLTCCTLCLCVLGCSPEKKVETERVLAPEVMHSLPQEEAVVLEPVGVAFADGSLDVYAYPRAIAIQEDITLVTKDLPAQRDAYLELFSLHMNRNNPNQDFVAASAALESAVALDPALGDNVTVQRWLDVFAFMAELRENQEVSGQLKKENEHMREALLKQQSSITYLETTLQELKKLEQDVAEKKRLYR